MKRIILAVIIAAGFISYPSYAATYNITNESVAESMLDKPVADELSVTCRHKKDAASIYIFKFKTVQRVSSFMQKNDYSEYNCEAGVTLK